LLFPNYFVKQILPTMVIACLVKSSKPALIEKGGF
jgi:hypothetical protein